MQLNTYMPPKDVLIDRQSSHSNLLKSLYDKPFNYLSGLANVFTLMKDYQGDNAFHDFLKNKYKEIPPGKVKVLTISFLSPSWNSICKRIVAIGNPVILKELRKIPRSENVNPNFLEHYPERPLISGGRPFGSVLEAIGMGVLTSGHRIHDPFVNEMKSLLSIRKIDLEENADANPFKKRFVENAIQETKVLLTKIESSITQNEPISLDFRFFALKIFLSSFYPEAEFSDSWILELSQIIEEVSDLAFKSMLNPYSNIDQLRSQAQEKLSPYLEKLMRQPQSSYLSEDYAKGCEKERLEQIIISLLFAGGDNIKKYLDHAFVEFGNDDIDRIWLSKDHLSEESIQDLITEVGRLHTVIYAQPGYALEDFVIRYGEETIQILAGDELHYTTWEANVDEEEWGADAHVFNPDIHKKNYRRLNAQATFGEFRRKCEGKSITLALIRYFVGEVFQKYRCEAFVDGRKNYHPTELNFNNGVSGRIEYRFRHHPSTNSK